MKKVSKLFGILMLLSATFTFNSCDNHYFWDDEEWFYPDGYNYGGTKEDRAVALAETMRGYWRGYIKVEEYDNYGKLIVQNFETDFQFDVTSSYGGRGLEQDYDNFGKLVYESSFSWYCNPYTEEIEFNFDDKVVGLMFMDSYKINSNIIQGRMISNDGTRQYTINLERTTFAKPGANFSKEQTSTRKLTQKK